jgi:stage III sporulation protein SpoIIIAA
MSNHKITDDLEALLGVLPPYISQAVIGVNDSSNLLEVILDLGRVPTARFLKGEAMLSEDEVTRDEIDYVADRIGEFDTDNRAGLERTLHRISAIRNRRGDVVGLTCRVGRAVYGTTDIIKDLIESGKSLLILGRPGVGKTTMLREAARILAENTRVVIVDTSNEIGGDGDVPHPAVGRARRMQVATPALQHEVMIEAVENHNPEVIVIDEIGRELEAAAARTIAERGVQLIGTAHGNTLENLLLNPTLSDLVGGIESVTLSDEEARRRGTQKTVLERRSPPTFDVLIEIQTRDRVAVNTDVAEAFQPEEIKYETIHIFPYGVARNRLTQAAKHLRVPIAIEKDLSDAQVVVTLRPHFRKRQRVIVDAENRGTPVYVLRSNTITQMERFLSGLFNLTPTDSRGQNEEEAIQQTHRAIETILNGERWVELSPASSYVRRLQHQIARQANLYSYSYGKEPNRRVRIYRE